MLRTFFRLIVVLLLLALSSGCQQQPPSDILHLSGETMGTTWSVALCAAPGGTDTAALRQQLQDCLDRINGLMSTYDPTSEISRFNDQTGSDWFAITGETAEVIALSLEISRLTDGAFDITVGPLVELWGFGARPRGAQIPSDEEVRASLAAVGYQHLELRREPAAIRKRVPQLRIDLSAVAKGYAVDALAGILKQQGIENYLVEIGGELQVAGERGVGAPWRIAIEKPLDDVREVETIIPLTGLALATSGNYRNFYLENGQRYAHSLDPVSGRPALHKLASVTVLDKRCARADALATALMVMGEERGRRLCEQLRIAAYFLIHDREALTVYASPAFQTIVQGIQP